MSLPMDTHCFECHLRRNLERARELGSGEKATEFARELMEQLVSAPKDASPPTMCPAINDLFRKHYGLEEDRFRQEKEDSNRFVLERMAEIIRRVDAAEDRVYAGLQFAILGNYIDFSALDGQLSFDELEEMLNKAAEFEVDADSYQDLLHHLQEGKKLLYITDNAGEICFDRVFAEKIAQAFPHLQITFCVRGDYAQNDATREGALLAGIPFSVIDNGNNIPGTVIELLSPEAKQAMDEADVIIAKGQGNVETMLGCGYNVYYAFLIKCIKFEEHFRKARLTPMLLKERK